MAVRQWGALATCGLLLGCGERPAAPEAAAVAAEAPGPALPAPPPAARAPVADPFPPDYLAMKAAAAATSVSYGNLDQDERSTANVALYTSFSMIDCAKTDDAEPDPRWRTDPLERLAKQVVGFAAGFKAAGYLGQVYEAPIADYERRQVAIITRGVLSVPEPELAPAEWHPQERDERELQHLVEVLERRRREFQPEMPRIDGEAGCGGGETPYRFRSVPAAASIWVASSFSFALCAARKVDPWDHEACNRWTEVGDGRARYLSGRFRYDARWPDGRTARGVRDLSEGDPDVDEDQQPIARTVIIRPIAGLPAAGPGNAGPTRPVADGKVWRARNDSNVRPSDS